MSHVDQLQEAEAHVDRMREEVAREEREARDASLRQAPLADTAGKARSTVATPLAAVGTMTNMRVGPLPEIDELAISIKETGLLQPPLVRATGDDDRPYELLAGRRRFAAMQLLDAIDGPRGDWTFTLVDGISRREALTMQFAENFHQAKPEPVQFARAARAIMQEDPELTAADVSRLVGAPADWTRRALKLLELPASIVERVERGDLSFTAAEIVRRGIARGDVSEERAEDLVEQAAGGAISSQELKHGVGYVPPKPKDYDELSRQLDEARWTAASEPASRDAGVDAEQRDWESGGSTRDRRDDDGGGVRAASAAPTAAEEAAAAFRARRAEVLDAYALGLMLSRLATDERRTALRIDDEAEAHRYAFSLRPQERLGALRALAAELLAADPDAPAEALDG